MFKSVFYTTSMTVSLDETHQLLTNLINYQDESLINEFKSKLDMLIVDVKTLDGSMLEFAKMSDDMNAYYAFLKIQNGILSYGENSRVLVARFSAHTDRAQLYELLYGLKDEVEKIKTMQAALLFRQSVYTERFYNAFETVIERNTYVIIFLTVTIIFFAIMLALRFTGTISNPIHRLVVYTRRIGEGDFGPVGKHGKLNAEIEMLYSSIDIMSSRLRELIKEIEQKADIERRLREEEIKNLKNENLLHRTEMELLQSQINPHFLFNTLNMINTLAQIEDAEQTGRMIESLSNLLRYILKRDTGNTCLREELEIIDDYIYIQLTRFGDRITYVKNIDDNTLNIPVPPVSLQPFVENAIIHGLEPKLGKGCLELSARITENNEVRALEIRIVDDGPGISGEILKKIRQKTDPRSKKRSLGIVNSMARLEMIYGPDVVRINSTEGAGVTVEINLPLS